MARYFRSVNSLMPRVGLALSGGAVLGYAHLGVLKVLEDHQIPIHCVAGTSVGSLVGALKAAGLSSSDMWKIGRGLNWIRIGGLTLPTRGLLDSRLLQRFVEQQIGKLQIGDLSLPFAATSVDLNTGEEVDWLTGPVGEAVRSSCIIPGIFTPFKKEGRVFADGGFRNFVPVNLARKLGADYVIAVQLVPSLDPTHLDNVFQILIRSLDLVVNQLSQTVQTGDAHIVPDLRRLNAHDFEQAEELMRRGETAAKAMVGQIKKDLGLGGVFYKIRRFWKKEDA